MSQFVSPVPGPWGRGGGGNFLPSSSKVVLRCRLAAEVISLKLLVDSNRAESSNNWHISQKLDGLAPSHRAQKGDSTVERREPVFPHKASPFPQSKCTKGAYILLHGITLMHNSLHMNHQTQRRPTQKSSTSKLAWFAGCSWERTASIGFTTLILSFASSFLSFVDN